MYSQYRRVSPGGRKPGRGGGGGLTILAVVVLAAALFFASSGMLGKWISENIVLPLLDNRSTPAPTDTSGEDLPGTTPDASPGENATGDVVLPGLTITAVQLGVYNSREAADTFANQVKQQGGAGYVYEDAGRYRVFAAAFEREADAVKVRDQLQASNVEAYLHGLEVPELNIEITAGQEQIEGLKAGFLGWQTLMRTVEEVYRLPSDQISQGRDLMTTGHGEGKAARDALAAQTVSGNDICEGMLALYDEFLPKLEETKNRADSLAFFGGVRYNYLDMFDAYRRYALGITRGN